MLAASGVVLSGVEVRRARVGEVAAISAVALSHGIALDRDDLRSGVAACAADDRIGRHLVAMAHGSVVGHAMAVRNAATGFEHTAQLAVSVAPDHQRMGVGSALVGTLKAWAGEVGVRRLVAICDVENAAMRHLLARQGFVCEAPVMLAYRQDGEGVVHACAQFACILG